MSGGCGVEGCNSLSCRSEPVPRKGDMCLFCTDATCEGGCSKNQDLKRESECGFCGEKACDGFACGLVAPVGLPKTPLPEPANKYMREVKPGVWVDVYDVLGGFTGHYPAQIKPIIDHAVKKLLAGGERGHKDLETDMKDVVVSMKRVMEKL